MMMPGSPNQRNSGRNKATPAEIAEWTRLYKIADADGSGNIDHQELEQLMNLLRQDSTGQTQVARVTRNEMERIIAVMDRDGDQQISLQEFINAMTEYSLRVTSLTGTRNDASFDDSSSTTAKITSSMTNFFQMFQTFDASHADRWLPRVLKRLLREEEAGGDDAEDIDIFWLTGRAPLSIDATNKVRGLHQLAQLMADGTQLRQWAQQLNQQPDKRIVDAHLTYILQIIRILEWFPTPADKVDVAPFIKGVFDYLHEAQLMPTIVRRCLESDNNINFTLMANLAIHSLEILYHYIPGPGLSTLFETDQWHYLRRKTKHPFGLGLTNQGGQIPLIVSLPGLVTTYIEQYRKGRLYSVRIAEYGIRIIGSYASSNKEDRIAIVTVPLQLLGGKTIVDWLVSLIVPNQAGHIISAVSWTLAILCGETHAENPHELPILNNAQGGSTLLDVLIHKDVISKLHYLMTTMKNALQNQSVPDCFDPQFIEIAFQDDNLLQMESNARKGRQQMFRIRTEVTSNICAAFLHLIPGFWQNGQYLQSQDGQAFIVNLQWFLGVSLEHLKSLPGQAPAKEDHAVIQTNASHLRVVHHTIACITKIIDLTHSSQSLHFNMLPGCLLAMLQLRRFPTLNANAARTVGTIVRNNTLLDSLVQHNGFVDALKGFLDDDEMQTRMTSIFKSLARHATPAALQVIQQCHVVKALFNCLSNFRSTDSQVAQAVNIQGGTTFNVPLAANIIMAANGFITNDSNQQLNKKMITEFTRHEMQAVNQLFETIFKEMTGNRDVARWQGVARDEGTSGHLYQVCVAFLEEITMQFQQLQNDQKYTQQAGEVTGISYLLKEKFKLLATNNQQQLRNIMRMEGYGKKENFVRSFFQISVFLSLHFYETH